MTTNKIIQKVQADTPMKHLVLPVNPASEELSDLELEAIAGGVIPGIPVVTGNDFVDALGAEASKQGPVVAFKYWMATAVTLMNGPDAPSATLESIFDPSKPLSFE